MDEDSLASIDPSLLNRFEKQKMSLNDVLNDRQKSLVTQLSNWTKQITTLAESDSKTHNNFTQKDLFIGFNKDETLQSLVINITNNNLEVNDNEILKKCKEFLIAIASSDGIIRAELSTLEQVEIDRWKRVYFNQQHHNSLYDYFDNLFDKEAEPKGQLGIIYTFSKINIDFKSFLQHYLRYQIYKLSTFKTEAQISKLVKEFFFESTDDILFIQCDISNINIKCIESVKYIIEKFRNEYLIKKETNEPIKHTFIIFHIQRDFEPNLIKSNFICGWKRITIESLEPPKIPLMNFLDKSLYDIINSELFGEIINSKSPFEEILQDDLLLLEHQVYNESHKNHIR
jgi:hypothetical protein